jgi:hypothetical protein
MNFSKEEPVNSFEDQPNFDMSAVQGQHEKNSRIELSKRKNEEDDDFEDEDDDFEDEDDDLK